MLLINLLKSVVSFRYEAYFYRNWLKKFVYKWLFYKRSGGPSHPDMIGRPKVFVTVQKTQNTGIALSSPCLKTKTGNSYFISACKCTLFDAAVSSDLYPDIVQILEGVCTNFVCTHFSNRRELKFTLDNWLLFLKVTSRKIRISNL